MTTLSTVAGKINAYVKHAIAVALSVAVSLGILDPATGTLHVSSSHAVYVVLIATGLSLLMSYAGLGAPSAPKTVHVQPQLQVLSPDALRSALLQLGVPTVSDPGPLNPADFAPPPPSSVPEPAPGVNVLVTPPPPVTSTTATGPPTGY